MGRAAAVVLAVVLVACGGDDGASEATTTTNTTPTAEATTSTEERGSGPIGGAAESSTTTTEVPPITFPVTPSAWSLAWNQIHRPGLALNGTEVAEFRPEPAGPSLFGSTADDRAAIYLEAEGRDGAVAAAIIATAPGEPSIPARIVSTVGGSMVDLSVAPEVIASFNADVVPQLGEITQLVTTYEVTSDLDLTIAVVDESESRLAFIWTPAGQQPSDVALSAAY